MEARGGTTGDSLATLIWSAHIGFDRALGYGLKYNQGFGFTHLGLIDRAAKQLPAAAKALH